MIKGVNAVLKRSLYWNSFVGLTGDINLNVCVGRSQNDGKRKRDLVISRRLYDILTGKINTRCDFPFEVSSSLKSDKTSKTSVIYELITYQFCGTDY